MIPCDKVNKKGTSCPLYIARIEDLEARDLLVVTCPCGHMAKIRPVTLLTARGGAHAPGTMFLAFAFVFVARSSGGVAKASMLTMIAMDMTPPPDDDIDDDDHHHHDDGHNAAADHHHHRCQP